MFEVSTAAIGDVSRVIFLQDQDQLPTEKALGAHHNVTTKRHL